MAISDSTANFLTQIRNARRAKHRFVDVYKNRLHMEVIKILKEQGFVDQFLVNDEKKKVRLFLKYSAAREPVMQDLKRFSKPGLRRYVGYREIPKICGGLGIAILTTSKGLFEGEAARKLKIGGELICIVW